MAFSTKNYNINLPDKTDAADITVITAAVEAVDAKMFEIENKGTDERGNLKAEVLKVSKRVENVENTKVDKVTGKGLSANDYTDSDKKKVDGLDASLEQKVDKLTGKGLSTNDYTDEDKAKVDGLEADLAGKADTAHTQAANTITSGTLPAGVVATNSTDYGTSRLRNIKASTTDLTAGSSALTSGTLYFVYE